jgi:hypothetical protein
MKEERNMGHRCSIKDNMKSYKHGFISLITPYIRMLDSDWLIAVIFLTNSGLAL